MSNLFIVYFTLETRWPKLFFCDSTSIMDFLLEIDDQPPDELFMAAVHDYEQSQTNAAENAHLQPRQGPSETHSNDNDASLRPLLSTRPGPSHRYAPPKSDNDVQLARIAGIPKTSSRHGHHQALTRPCSLPVNFHSVFHRRRFITAWSTFTLGKSVPPQPGRRKGEELS